MKNKKITQQQQQQHTDTSTEIVSYFLDHLSFSDDYSYVLLLLKFMCSCTSTRTITGQQHEMVTTTTHSDLHRLLSVQELIFPIQQQNMNTSSEKLMLICTCHLIIGGYIWALHMTSWPSWTLHLKTWPNLLSVTYLGTSSENLTSFCHLYTSSYLGGYIWQLILVLHLTSWPSCALHLKTWRNSAICFKWALIDNIDQQRLHLLSLAVSCGGVYLRAYLGTSSENLNTFAILCFASQKVFLYYIQKT